MAQARASVMIYNNDLKKWEHAGGVGGLSRCHIYFNPANNSYRIVGRKINDNDVSSHTLGRLIFAVTNYHEVFLPRTYRLIFP